MSIDFFVLLMIGVLVWVIYITTFRTDDWLRLVKEDEERRTRRHERMGKAAGGAVKAGLFAIKLFRR